jgi:phosphoglycerate dehydrogenase-like enzyme
MITVYLGAPEGEAAAREILAGTSEVVHPGPDPQKVAAALRTADALLDASMKVPITNAMVSAAPALKIISCATTGSDHIALEELSSRGIPVRTLREDGELLRNITPAAELTFALLLACARRLPAALSAVKAGRWVREDFPGMMLHGRQLGIVGCGRIGGWMARYARAFGMYVVGYDPVLQHWPDAIRPVSLQELVETSDIVTVHVHLSDATRGLISADLFGRMKEGTIFLNTSRGAVADEAALLDALQSGRLAAAGLDVLEGEPNTANHPLVRYAQDHDNLLITPHVGGFSPDAVRIVCARAAEKIRDQLLGVK